MKTKKSISQKNHFSVYSTFIFIALILAKNAGATNYYISSAGNDAASGLTPSTSWLTIAKINKSKFLPGDSILFKRGDAWREGQALYALSNGTAGHPIVFGTYGNGAKPLILASRDISSPVFWTYSSVNMWKTTTVINITSTDGRGRRTPDVANVIFNNEESVGVKKRFLSGLTKQGDFCLNLVDTLLYLYSGINPSKYYKKIEATGIRNSENNIEVINGHYITFTNLDIRYSKNNGLFLSKCSNVEINYCDFSYIGGCYYPIQTFMLNPDPNTARMGNGVQIWAGNSDVTVKYCNFNQVYDAGISPQGVGSIYSIHNLKFHHNLINNCYYSFEFWGHEFGSTGDSIFFENNTCINAGSGWSTFQRPDKSRAAHLQFSTSKMAFSKVYIRNNIFSESVNHCSDGTAEYAGSGTDAVWAGITMDYNCYYQSYDRPIIRWRGGGSPSGGIFYLNDLEAYRTLSGKERNSMFIDPVLTTNQYLLTSSPVIDKGMYVGYPYNGDAPDIGAFEFSTSENHVPSIMIQRFKLPFNTTIGTAVGMVIASDQDAGQLLTYSILSGNTNDSFSINSSTGMISVNTAAELYSDFELVIEVQDNGSGNLSNNAAVTINALHTGLELPGYYTGIKVYPNPVSENFIIEIEKNYDLLDFEILNSTGKVVFSGKMSEKAIVPSNNFSRGVYLLKVDYGNGCKFIKILKL